MFFFQRKIGFHSFVLPRIIYVTTNVVRLGVAGQNLCFKKFMHPSPQLSVLRTGCITGPLPFVPLRTEVLHRVFLLFLVSCCGPLFVPWFSMVIRYYHDCARVHKRVLPLTVLFAYERKETRIRLDCCSERNG